MNDETLDTVVFDVLYEDEWLCVINKPAQMLMHRSPIATTDTVFVLQSAREQFNRHIWPVHRLDRGTSGALILSFDEGVAQDLGRQMMAGTVKKRYCAMTRGWIEAPLLVDYPIKPVPDDYIKNQNLDPQPARSIVTPCARAEVPVALGRYEATRLGMQSVELLTGRRHQIRHHLKTLAHPIIGDSTYGKGPLNRAMSAYFGVDRLMLHCARLVFVHPKTGRVMDVCAPLEARMASVFDRLGWSKAYAELLAAPWQDERLETLSVFSG